MQWSLILLFMMAQCCFMDSHLYQFHYINEYKNWTDAQRYCREKHTDLVTVTNMKDMKRLINISDGDQREAWIGLYDQTHGTRTWFWSQPGVEFNESETNWNPGEPNDDGPQGYENCVVVNTNLKWNDIPCQCAKHFLCYNETNTTHKYHWMEEKKSWIQAQSYCREKHTDLISGTKQLQEEEVKMMINSISDSSHIGLFSDTWRWSDGSSFSFRHWNSIFNYQNPNSGQCAMTKFYDEGRWTNVNCGIEKPFICYDDKVVLVKEKMTWENALTYCRGHHHDLVTITNMDDQRWIQEKVKEASTGYVWMGLRFSCRLRVWFWVCPPTGYENKTSAGQTSDCHMYGAMETRGKHKWFQKKGTEKFNFICSTK